MPETHQPMPGVRGYEMPPDIRAMLNEAEARRQKAAAQERKEWFTANDEQNLPDLEFLTPNCPMCGLPTEFDDGSFTCQGCCTTWPPSGYGHEAFRWNDPSDSDEEAERG